MRIDQFRELGEDLHDLIRTLAARSHHDDIRITLLGYRMLKHSLAAAERSRDEARTAFGNRIERVNDPDTCFHDPVRSRLLLIGFHSHLYRPFLYHRHRHIIALRIGQHSHSVVDIVLTGRGEALHCVCPLE